MKFNEFNNILKSENCNILTCDIFNKGKLKKEKNLIKSTNF